MTNNKYNQYGDVQTLSMFGFSFIVIGTLLQLLVYFFTGSPILSLISGITGVISVALCSNRKISFYVFGFIQLITYVILCVEQKLYGEIIENAFYFVTMLYGIFHWSSNYNNLTQEVETRSMSREMNLFTAIATLIGITAFYIILNKTDDTQPFIDSITTIPALAAQILMITRYKESWIYWLVIDVGSIIMWSKAGDWCMVSQFVLWTINCIYGLKKW